MAKKGINPVIDEVKGKVNEAFEETLHQIRKAAKKHNSKKS